MLNKYVERENSLVLHTECFLCVAFPFSITWSKSGRAANKDQDLFLGQENFFA